MLSKKLERMAAEERRQQRLRRRAARKAAAAAAAAADGAAAPPPAGPEAASGRAEGAQPGLEPELKEGHTAVQFGEQAAERLLGFGAALKRLLSNPEVGTAVRTGRAAESVGFAHHPRGAHSTISHQPAQSA